MKFAVLVGLYLLLTIPLSMAVPPPDKLFFGYTCEFTRSEEYFKIGNKLYDRASKSPNGKHILSQSKELIRFLKPEQIEKRKVAETGSNSVELNDLKESDLNRLTNHFNSFNGKVKCGDFKASKAYAAILDAERSMAKARFHLDSAKAHIGEANNIKDRKIYDFSREEKSVDRTGASSGSKSRFGSAHKE